MAKKMRKRSSIVGVVLTLLLVMGLPLISDGENTSTRAVRVSAKGRAVIKGYRSSHALLVGASRYTAGWPKLTSIPQETDEIEAALKTQGFKVTKVMNPNAENLKDSFEEFIGTYGYIPGNRLLFFFSGHGYSRKDGMGYLVPTDAPDPRKDPGGFYRRALSMSQILTWCREMTANHALFLFDSCFSGAVFKAKALPEFPPHISALTVKPVRQFISAGDAGEEVPAQSVFAPSFIKALRGEADLSGDGFITGTELGMYLHDKVIYYASGQTPQYGKIKDPRLDEGDFVFQLVSDPVVAKPRLYVKTKPSTAVVRILNIVPKFTQGMELSPGRYHVEVSSSGYSTQREWIELSSGVDRDLDIRLEPKASPPSGNDYVSTAKPTSPITSSGAAIEKNTNNSLGMEFVYIKPGTFMMGSPSNEKGREDDERQHQVTLTNEYYLQTTEVTQGQWEAVMGDNPSSFKKCGKNCPVENVSWDDILEFIKKLNQRDKDYQYRLPTEAEWEYAARAGSWDAFASGDVTETGCEKDRNLDAMGWYCYNSKDSTHPVGSKEPNAWGLYDMHGNVLEWCQDWYGDYPSGSVTNPQGPGPSLAADRVLRGGSWYYLAGHCRSACRNGRKPIDRDNDLGFRLAAFNR